MLLRQRGRNFEYLAWHLEMMPFWWALILDSGVVNGLIQTFRIGNIEDSYNIGYYKFRPISNKKEDV